MLQSKYILLGFVLVSSRGSLGGFRLSHDTERTRHTKWSIGNLDIRGKSHEGEEQ